MTITNTGNDYISAHSEVGESGQGMTELLKQSGSTTGETGRAFAATLFEVEAINRLAKAQGKSYGVTAIVLTHGETDAGNTNYKNQMYRLWSDYNNDIKAITGQTESIPMFVSQQHGFPKEQGQRSVATLAQWQIGVENPGNIICTGPKYQLPGYGDGTHLSAEGYKQLGEKLAEIYYEVVVEKKDWQPLQPVSTSRNGNSITVNFHVPVPPLTWDTSMPNPTLWPNGRGFEVRLGSRNISISSVKISGSSVVISCGESIPPGATVGYAITSNGSTGFQSSTFPAFGHLKDSDPFTGQATRAHLPNYCVSFEMTVN